MKKCPLCSGEIKYLDDYYEVEHSDPPPEKDKNDPCVTCYYRQRWPLGKICLDCINADKDKERYREAIKQFMKDI